MAKEKQSIIAENEDTQHGKYLIFALGTEVFGIDIKHVTEIVGMQFITALPEVPAYIKGIINLRGKIIPVIDSRLKFKKESIPYSERTCIIVINIQDTLVGLIVDKVSEVLTIDDKNIVPPPYYSTGIQNKYIRGIGKVGNDVKLLLECEKLFCNEEMQLIIENS